MRALMRSTVAESTPSATPLRPACTAATAFLPTSAMSTGMQSAVCTATPTPAAFVISASPHTRAPGATSSARTTSLPCTCLASTSRPGGNSAAAKKRLLFSATLAGVSPRARPRFNEPKGPALTPPLRVLNAWDAKPSPSSRDERKNSTPPTSRRSRKIIRIPFLARKNSNALRAPSGSGRIIGRGREVHNERPRNAPERGGTGGGYASPGSVRGKSVVAREGGPLRTQTPGGQSVSLISQESRHLQFILLQLERTAHLGFLVDANPRRHRDAGSVGARRLRLRARNFANRLVSETRRDDGSGHLVFKAPVGRGAKDNVGLGVGLVVDDLASLVHFEERHLLVAGGS